MLVKDKKKVMWRAITFRFNFSHILANVIDNMYYQSVISTIQRAGQGLDLLRLKDMYGELLHSKKELERWKRVDKLIMAWRAIT